MTDTHIYIQTARKAIVQIITQHKRLQPSQADLLGIKCGCFVSLHNSDNSLRGCIGTIEPRTEDLFYEIVQNAISAATQDPRFAPVTTNELEQLHISVDVLSKPEPTTIKMLDAKKYGVIITDGFRKGVLLPNLEGIDSVENQIDIVKRKAGIYSTNNANLTILRFESTRYE